MVLVLWFFFFVRSWSQYSRVEKNLVEHGDKIPQDVKDEVKTAVEECKAAMESEDAEEIQGKVSALQVS